MFVRLKCGHASKLGWDSDKNLLEHDGEVPPLILSKELDRDPENHRNLNRIY